MSYEAHTEEYRGMNKYTCELGDGTRLFYSYKTLIGFSSPRIRHAFTCPVFTEEKYSATTGRHKRTFLSEYGGTTVSPRAFQLLREEAGV